MQTLQGKQIYTNKEIQQINKDKIAQFKENLLQQFQNTPSYDGLKFYLINDVSVNKYVRNHKLKFEKILVNVCHCLNHLPIYQNHFELLPVFAQKYTKDPHYFDKSLTRELLLKGIEYIFHYQESYRTIEQINQLYYEASLLKDDISNNCYICHIKPKEETSGWNGFYEVYEPWNMNLYNLMNIKGYFYQSSIYIVENPSVFRILVDYIHRHYIDVGLICSNGQINLCTYMLLDKLTQSHCQLYYAGDFDPEGLMIADKLIQRYPQLQLWHYDIDLFKQNAIIQKNISMNRLQIMKNLHHEKLIFIAQEILIRKLLPIRKDL